MNKYMRKFFKIMPQSKQTQQSVRIQPQPLPTSPDEWYQYWQARGFPWRTEPEIDAKRQQELAQHRGIPPNFEMGIYPFRGMKLSRADVEWLLATHEERKGLDLRGADLSNENLSSLPLSNLCCGISSVEVPKFARKLAAFRIPFPDPTGQSQMAAAIMRGTIFQNTHLEGAILCFAQLEGADFSGAQLEGADFSWAQLEGASFLAAHLKETRLSAAQLRKASFVYAYLEGTFLISAQLEETNLYGAHLEGVDLTAAILKRTRLMTAQLEHTELANVTLVDEAGVGPELADVQWSTTNLAVVDWSQVKMLGDETRAKQYKTGQGKKTKQEKMNERKAQLPLYEGAVRANRQLAIALENQGLNEGAARFAHRACSLQREVYWRQRNFWKWLGSVMLAVLAGYGYSMWRILVAYAIVVLAFAGIYFVFGMFYEPHLSFLDAILTSITAFHGRVFSEPFLRSGEPQLWVTASEAIAGLVIEGVFIAMLIQRFFGK